MALRNFWAEAQIDGRQTTVGCGPLSKNGGMRLTIYQRDEGLKTTAFTVYCVEQDGKLYSEVYDGNHALVAKWATKR